jgi:hypothetical protein
VRIAFLTGSLEPVEDGVGDYSRLLAAECARQGAGCCLIAIADRFIDQPTHARESGADVVRLPYRLSWRARLNTVERITAERPLDWASLQFVPYSFQRCGWPAHLVWHLQSRLAPARLHVMLHEIWIEGGRSWKQRLVSAGQRHLVRKLCRQSGVLVHTSNRTYQDALAGQRITAARLPLFGSLPLSAGQAWEWLTPALAAAGCDADRNRAGWWLCVVFGTLHPVWPPEPLLSRLASAAAGAHRRIALLSVGRLGSGESLWRRLETDYAARIPTVRLGELSAERISELLNTVDFGIATSPYSLLGKSATVAAMFEHGLPVIVNRQDGWTPSSEPLDPTERDLVIRPDDRFERRLTTVKRGHPQRRLPAVARQFLADLDAASSASW